MNMFLRKHNVKIVLHQGKASGLYILGPNVKYEHGFARAGKLATNSSPTSDCLPLTSLNSLLC